MEFPEIEVTQYNPIFTRGGRPLKEGLKSRGSSESTRGMEVHTQQKQGTKVRPVSGKGAAQKSRIGRQGDGLQRPSGEQANTAKGVARGIKRLGARVKLPARKVSSATHSAKTVRGQAALLKTQDLQGIVGSKCQHRP